MVYNSVTNVPQTTELYTFCDQTVRHVTSILKKKKQTKKTGLEYRMLQKESAMKCFTLEQSEELTGQ